MKTKVLARWGFAALLAGQGAGVAVLDLKTAYEGALAGDPVLKAARAAADSSKERLPQAKSQLLPSIGLSGSWNKNRLETIAPNVFGQQTTSNDRYTSKNETLTIRQPIFRKQPLANYQQALHWVEESDANWERERQNLSVRVASAYFEALLARDQLSSLAAQKAATLAQLDAARKMFAAGSGTRTDIDDAQARLDMTVAQAFEAVQNVDFTTRQLESLAEQPAVDLAKLDSSRLASLLPNPSDLTSWTERAVQNSPEIKALKARRDAMRLDIEKAGAGHYPTLDAVAQWSRSASENVTRINSQYTTASLGLQLSVPLYSGGYVSSSVRQAIFELERAEQALMAGTRELGLRVHREFRGVSEGVQRVRALEQALKSAEQALMSSKKSFTAGVRTLLDTLNAEQQKGVAERDLAQARYLTLMSKMRLMSLVGEADLPLIQEVNAWLRP